MGGRQRRGLRQRDGVGRSRAFCPRGAVRSDLGGDRYSLPRVYRSDRLSPLEMDYSVVIPLFNERDSVTPLHAELTRAMEATGRAYELLFVDDGSTDDSFAVLRQIKSGDRNVRV